MHIYNLVNAEEFNSYVSTTKGLTSIQISGISQLPEGLIFPNSVKEFSITTSEHDVFELPKSPPICKNLENLIIISCYNMKELFPLQNFPNLKTLKISECPNLETIPSLSNCKNLEGVDLKWCGNLQLTDESIKELQTLKTKGCSVSYPDHLKHLSINSTNQEGSMNSGISPQPTNEAGTPESNTLTFTQRVWAGFKKCITPVVDQDQTPGTGVTRARAKELESTPDKKHNI